MFSRLLFACAFLIVSIYADAQDPVCRIINSQNDLPTNTVYDIAQDSTGFIWIAHNKGLSRYDGREMISYTSKKQQGKGRTSIMFIGKQVWTQDFYGNYYYVQGDEMLKDKIFHNQSYIFGGLLYNRFIISLENDSLKGYDVFQHKVHRITVPQTQPYAHHKYINENGIYYLSDEALYFFNGKKVSLERKFTDRIPTIFYLNKFGKKFYGFTKNTDPYVYDLSDSIPKKLDIFTKEIFIQQVQELNNEIWVSTSNGAYCFDMDFNPKYGGHCFFKGDNICKVIFDKEGSYWFATQNNGVLYVPNIHTKIYPYEEESITAISAYTDNEHLLLGTANNHILSFDVQTNTFEKIYQSEYAHPIYSLYYDKKNNNILYASDKVALLKDGKSINYFQVSARSITQINDDFYAIAYNAGFGIFGSDPKDTLIPIWLRKQLTKKSNGVFPFKKNSTKGRCVLFNKNTKTLYASTANGLFFYTETQNGEIKHKGKSILCSQMDLYQDYILVSTFEQGVFKIKNEKVEWLNEKENSLGLTYLQIKVYNNNVWLLNEDELIKYDVENKNIISYNAADGIPTSELKEIFPLGDKLFIATSIGLVELNQKNSKNSTPSILINGVLINNSPVDLKLKNEFNHTENNLRIHFSVPTYKSNQLIKVRYRVNQSEWENIDKYSSYINLSSLSPGKYTIEIEAFSPNKKVSAGKASLNFSIRSPFYKTSWFFALIFIIIVLLMYLFFKIRLNSERKRNELQIQKNSLEQELQQSLLTSIKSQMNPHFLFNALNTIQSYIYTNDKENASQYLGKFSDLTRMILDMSNKDIVSLEEEIKSLRLYLELEQIRFEDKLNYRIHIDAMLNLDTSFIPSMLIQPYIENAIKHGLLHKKNDWRLTISFEKKNNELEVTVDDNGIGRKKSKEFSQNKLTHRHQSFAVNANQKRLEILNKDLTNSISLKITDKEDEFGNSLGTNVCLRIPFSYKK